MKKIIFAAALLAASVATGASAKTVLVETFPGGATSSTTTSGNVGIANGATYNPCCGTPSGYSDYFAAFGGGNDPSGTLSASFSTVLGKLYTFSFDYGALGGGSEALYVNIAGGLHTFNPTANNDLYSTFSPGTFSFLGTGGSTTLVINSQGVNNVDAIADNIRVTTVPEPAVWGLMILGFGAIGGALRRRKADPAFA